MGTVAVNTLEAGYLLDYLVAKAVGKTGISIYVSPEGNQKACKVEGLPFRPSTEWSDLGPILEVIPGWAGNHREKDGRIYGYAGFDGVDHTETASYQGMKVAVCHAIVLNSFGKEVELPF